MNVNEEEVVDAKQVDIVAFLKHRGTTFKKRGNAMICSSPFASDSTPSFYVYPDNCFKCYSTGRHGDSINLVQELLGIGFQEAVRNLNGGVVPKFEANKYIKHIKKREPFVLDKYIVNNLKESIQIDNYAKSRKITDNYERCFYYYYNDILNEFERKLAVGFVHTDPKGEIVGVKMRNIDVSDKARYTMRGRIGFYLVDVATLDLPKLFVVEGEANTASLAAFFKSRDYSAIVISFGGVAVNVGKVVELNSVQQFEDLETYIIIDEDGNKDMYEERLLLYKNLKGTPINLELKKGEDINSLYINEEYSVLNKLLK